MKWEAPDLVLPVHTGPAVGVDVGLTSLLALTDDLLVDGETLRAKDGGAIVVNKRFYKRAEQKLAQAQQRVSRRKRGSRRRRQAALQVARKHERIRR